MIKNKLRKYQDKAVSLKEKIMNILSQLNTHLNSIEFKNKYCEKVNNFIRKRKLTFTLTILFIMNFRKGSTQAELNQFFNIPNISDIVPPKKSAFFKARLKIKPEAFLDLLRESANYFYRTELADGWYGFRLISSDGSTFTIPLPGNGKKEQELIQQFGVATNQFPDTKVIQAKGFILYDVLNEIIISGVLTGNSVSERSILVKQLDKLSSNDLLLLDRGFPAVWLFWLLDLKKIQYVIRIPLNFLTETDNFFKSDEKDKIIKLKITEEIVSQYPELSLPTGEIKIRLVKVFLPGGEIEVLATSLIDKVKYPQNLFGDLYFKRWSGEVGYNSLKNKLQIEWFSGKSVRVILQDFYAKLFQKNLFSIISKGASEELKENTSNLKYEYAINENIGYSILKNRWVKLFLDTIKEIKDLLEEIIKKFLKYIEPIRPLRKYFRIKKVISKSTIISFANRIAI